jgi:hypothetical protein
MKSAFITLLGIAGFLIGPAQTKEYFQQQVDYTIEVSLDDDTHVIRGFESFVYQNNSQESLDFIYIHLWPNAYKNKKTALAKQLIKMGNTAMYFASENELGYIDSLNFKVNGQKAQIKMDTEHIDIAKLVLGSPLLPGESVEISTPFKVKLPSGDISRLGHIGQSYQITQWYPKPAVYDSAGWHQMPYLTQGEFYSEFGSYDVKIDLPSNYVVGATGDLQTASEIEWLTRKASQDSIWVEKRKKEEDWQDHDTEFPQTSDSRKILHYKQSKVHDFAWFADKRFHVLKGTVELPKSKRSVDVFTMFTNQEAELWSKSIEYMHDAIYYYSLWNGDYPYNQATAVDGTISAGGGMEYPNVTVIGASGDDITLETVIMHEVGHNWFYGILGSNERDYPWLDEGINSYNEQRYLSTKHPNRLLFVEKRNKLAEYIELDNYRVKDMHFLTYLYSERANTDQPINTHSAEFSTINYGSIVYSKSAVFLNYLRSYLGDAAMDSAMHRYFEVNKFQHPYPGSFQNAFAPFGDSLDWFFNESINSGLPLDYKIKKAKSKNGQTHIKLKNKGGVDGPVLVQLSNGRKLEQSLWIAGFKRDTVFTLKTEAELVSIDKDGVMPEVNRNNNTSKTRGLFKRIEPLQLKLGGALENPKKNQIFFTPTVAYNAPSGFMPGVAVYNALIPTKKWSYIIAPMFSFKTNTLTGALDVAYRISPSKSIFESIELGARGKSYVWFTSDDLGDTQYMRAEPFLNIYFRPKSYSSLWRNRLELSSVNTAQLNTRLEQKSTLNSYQFYNRLAYFLEFKHPVFKSTFTARLEQHTEFVKLDLELINQTRISEKLTVKTRLFVGQFLNNNSTNPAYNYRMDGQSWVNQTDYAFDAELIGRNGQTFFSQQLTNTHGGFKIPTPVGQSNAFLAAANFELKYGKLPIGVFADFGTSSSNLIADAGLMLSFADDVIACYFPLLYSESIRSSIDARGLDYRELIRFKLDLDRWNVLVKARRFEI